MAQTKIMRAWNPAALMLVNGGKQMAAKKAIAKRPNTTMKLVPFGHNHHGHHNKPKARRRNNPGSGTKALLVDGLWAGAGAVATELLVGLLPWSFAWYIKAGIKAGTGIGLAAVSEKFAFTRGHSAAIGLGGVAVGASELIRNVVPSLAAQAGAVVQELIPIQLPAGAPTPVGAISAADVQRAAQAGNQVAQAAAAQLAGYQGMGDIMFLPSARGLSNKTAGLGDLIYFPALRAA